MTGPEAFGEGEKLRRCHGGQASERRGVPPIEVLLIEPCIDHERKHPVGTSRIQEGDRHRVPQDRSAAVGSPQRIHERGETIGRDRPAGGPPLVMRH